MERLHAALSPVERQALAAVRVVGDALGLSVYLVGGGVRDLLLGTHAPDLDVTVEGDAPALAQSVAAALGLAPPVVHTEFRTATLRGEGLNLDFITARREVYPHPGALPVVTPASLVDDLARRDFTINALALGLTGTRHGDLIDPHGGRADLDRGLVRVLHDRSFQDDATRLARAARYSGRFRFRLDEGTAAAARRDARFLETISPARVRHEFERTFAEARPERALAVLETLGVPGALVPGLRFGASVRAAYRRLPVERGILPWLVPVAHGDAAMVQAYSHRLALHHREAVAARALPAVRTSLTRLVRTAAPPSMIVAALDRLPVAAVQALACFDPRSQYVKLARRYLAELRHVRPWLSTGELQALGVPAGPLFGDLIRQMRAARLDNPALTLDAERAIVHDRLQQAGRS